MLSRPVTSVYTYIIEVEQYRDVYEGSENAMYQQQSPPEALLPHERVRPGCVISSIVGLILFWLYFTIIGIFNGNILLWWLATVLCIVLIGLLIIWLAYAKKRPPVA